MVIGYSCLHCCHAISCRNTSSIVWLGESIDWLIVCNWWRQHCLMSDWTQTDMYGTGVWSPRQPDWNLIMLRSAQQGGSHCLLLRPAKQIGVQVRDHMHSYKSKKELNIFCHAQCPLSYLERKLSKNFWNTGFRLALWKYINYKFY